MVTRKALLPLVFALLMLLAGCGSLVRVPGSQLAGGMDGGMSAAGSQGSEPDSAGPDSADPANTGGGSAAGGAVGGGQGGVDSPGGASSTSGGAGPANNKPIKVGVTEANIAAIAGVFGKSDQNTSDTPKAIINYINKHGGIGGRQIDPVVYTADSSQDSSTAAQQACAAFTQDTKVDVVVDLVLGGDQLPTCLQQKGIAEITAGNTALDNVDLKQHPNMIQPSAMQIDREIQALLQISAARNVLKAGDKLGVMVESCPGYTRTYDNVVVPFAKQLGVAVTQSSVKCITNLVQDLGPVTNDVQRAALAFSSAGVTHVMAISVAEAFLIANFTNNASQQKYYPKYLVTSNAYPWGNSQSDATVRISADALPNMSGVGYLPLLDVGTQARPADGGQAARQGECTNADPTQYGAASENDSGKSFKQSVFYTTCDAFFIMKATLEAAGMRLGYTDVARAFLALKQRGEPSGTLNNGRIGGPATSLDGVGFVQPFAYDTNRQTFRYVGGSVATS